MANQIYDNSYCSPYKDGIQTSLYLLPALTDMCKSECKDADTICNPIDPNVVPSPYKDIICNSDAFRTGLYYLNKYDSTQVKNPISACQTVCGKESSNCVLPDEPPINLSSCEDLMLSSPNMNNPSKDDCNTISNCGSDLFKIAEDINLINDDDKKRLLASCYTSDIPSPCGDNFCNDIVYGEGDNPSSKISPLIWVLITLVVLLLVVVALYITFRGKGAKVPDQQPLAGGWLKKNE